jgi:hypothetical protein
MENIPPEQTPPPYTNEQTAQQGSYQRPADYYAAPPAPAQKSGCAKWGLLGCGLGGCLVVVLLLVAGGLVMRGGMGRIVEFALSRLDREALGMMSSEVTPEQRAEFTSQVTQLRANLGAKRVELVHVQPILQELRDATRDNVLSPDEVRDLTETMRDINSRVAAPR